MAFLPAVRTLAQDWKTADKFCFVAHRGASYLAPENTLASIHPSNDPKTALEMRAMGVSVDQLPN